MSDQDAAYSVDVKIQRGNGTDDRDTLKATVQAETLDELDERKNRMLERLDELAEQVRAIQPASKRRLTDDQSTLGDQEAES